MIDPAWFANKNMEVPQYVFHKSNEKNEMWEVERPGVIGEFLFSFDKQHVFNFWSDYPHKLTPKQIDIFKDTLINCKEINLISVSLSSF